MTTNLQIAVLAARAIAKNSRWTINKDAKDYTEQEQLMWAICNAKKFTLAQLRRKQRIVQAQLNMIDKQNTFNKEVANNNLTAMLEMLYHAVSYKSCGVPNWMFMLDDTKNGKESSRIMYESKTFKIMFVGTITERLI